MFGRKPTSPTASARRKRRLNVQALEDRRLLAAAPELLADINPGDSSSSPAGFVSLAGTTYFTANDTEVWKSDGTAAGTTLVKDLSGVATNVSKLAVHGNALVFLSFDDKSTFDYTDDTAKLWKSDGTTAGTVTVHDFDTGTYLNNYSSDGTYFASVGGTLFFGLSNVDDGNELWKSDGLVSASLVKDIQPGAGGSFPNYFTPFNGKLYFSADDGVNGAELWVSDGTSTGTQLLKDVNPGSGGAYPRAAYNRGLLEFNGELYFAARTDGVDGIAFNSDDTSQLWKSDGTTAGTTLVKDFGAGGAWGGYAGNLTISGNTLFGTVDTAADGLELWKSDGTEAGTQMVKDINPSVGAYGGYGSFPSGLTDVNGTLFFTADDGEHGSELWKSDGTAAGTVMVKDINPSIGAYGARSSYPWSLTNVDGVLYFTASDGQNGNELWKSDGTASGTVMVYDINTTATGGTFQASSYPYYLAYLNGSLFFSADDGIHGSEPWALKIGGRDSLAFYHSSSGVWQVGLSDTTQFNVSNWATIPSASPWANFMEGDFNGDGFTDIFRLNTASGAVRILESNGSSGFTDSLWGVINPNSPWANFLVGDFNNDGLDDVFRVNATGGGIRVLQSNGSAFVDTVWGTQNPNSPFAGYDVGDFNGDGRDDVVRRNTAGGGVRVLKSSGTAFVDELWGTYNPNSPWADWTVGDFNGDGNDDIFRWNTSGGGVRVLNSSGTAFVDELWGVLNPNAVWTDFLVGDFDGNGSDDILFRNSVSGGLRLMRESAAGDSFDNVFWGAVNPNVSWTDFRVGDFDGDGRDDLARRHPTTQAVRVLKSGPSGFAADELWAVLGGSPTRVLKGEFGA